MKSLIQKICIFCTLFFHFSCSNSVQPDTKNKLDLSGNWSLVLDSSSHTIQTLRGFPDGMDSMFLPGTTDLAKKGFYNTDRTETNYLSREYIFEGQAIYSKQVSIPAEWENTLIRLCMERTKPSKVFIDGIYIGENDNISTAQYYDLPLGLEIGEHTLSIVVDNRPTAVPGKVFHSSHAYSASTQTNWNGIIGEFYLESLPFNGIESVMITPDYESKKAFVNISFRQNSKNPTKGKITLQAEAQNTKKPYNAPTQTFDIECATTEQTFEFPLGSSAPTWSEFSPVFFKLTATWTGEDGTTEQMQETFGLRSFKTKGKQFVINDKKTFLRGKHDACVFPLTGHTAMDVDTWRHYFQVAKSYGINHYRFHSWCPPKACFEAADIEGIYLQPELPIWGSIETSDTTLCNYLLKEGRNLHQAYGNHASFVMFALGNEMWGEKALTLLVDSLRNYDNRHLFAAGSNNALGFNGPLPNEDYYTTCRIGQKEPNSFETHTRASFSFADAYEGGYLNQTYPNSVMDFKGANELCSVPVISHETGQFQIYPDYAEIKKYTGALKPYNFEVFKQRLSDAGLNNQAEEFTLASGKWSTLLYRADIEMNLRTPEWGGFQLLDLQDYPGQGSAYIGILDAFMDSKGFITPEEWRNFCSEVVPLLKIEKFCWTTNEAIEGEIVLSNYSADNITGKTLCWTITDNNEKLLDSGKFPVSAEQGSIASIGKIRSLAGNKQQSKQLLLTLAIENTTYKNTYPLWVYPENKSLKESGTVTVCHSLNDHTLNLLNKGTHVLLYPAQQDVAKQTIPGLFQTDYWNYRMFKTICENIKKPVSPGTLGILTDPNHPVFKNFPTDYHTNWQWYAIIKQSYPMILDALPTNYKPIVQVIDNIERNHKLGLLYELNVGKGKILVCMTDLNPVIKKPEARQWYNSLIEYMESEDFKPALTLTTEELKALFNNKAEQGQIKQLGNISYE